MVANNLLIAQNPLTHGGDHRETCSRSGAGGEVGVRAVEDGALRAGERGRWELAEAAVVVDPAEVDQANGAARELVVEGWHDVGE